MENYFIGMWVFVLGSAVGSFLNVLIDRLSHNQPITGRSHCDSCKRTLTWYELVPIISYVIQAGRARCCQKTLSPWYPIVEVLTGLIFVCSWFFIEPQMYVQSLPISIQSFLSLELPSSDISQIALPEWKKAVFQMFSMGLLSCLIVMVVADTKYYIIPDSMQIGALLFPFFTYILLAIPIEVFIYKLISIILVMLPIFLLYLGTRGRGMGFADVKFAGVMGFLLGAYAGFWALYIAFISGAIISVITLVLRKKKAKSRIPFGPFLILGTLVLFLAPDQVYDTIKTFFY